MTLPPTRRQTQTCDGVCLALAVLVTFLTVNTSFAQVGSKGVIPIRKSASDKFGNNWAVLIGAEKYRDAPELHFCVNDMLLLGDALLRSNAYDADRVWFLGNDSTDFQRELAASLKLPRNRDRKADLGDIRATIKEVVAKCEPGDSLLIAFSGHGAVDEKGESYLIPLPGHEQLADQAVSVRWLLDLLRDKTMCKAARKMVILDACHSGAALGIQVSGLSDKIPESTEGTEQADEGTVLFVSCRQGEKSFEYPTDETHVLRQGIFSHFLVRAFQGAPEADIDRDGLVTPSECFAFVSKRVKEFAAAKSLGSQHPQWKVLDGDARFVIARRNDWAATEGETSYPIQMHPGFTGAWWFVEMPLLAPRLRLELSRQRSTLKIGSENVAITRELMENNASSLIGKASNRDSLVALLKLKSSTKRQLVIQEMIQSLKQTPSIEAVDQHLLAVLYLQDGQFDLAETAFNAALLEYDYYATAVAQKGLHCLCLTDYAKLLATRGNDSLAIDKINLALSKLGEEATPEFKVYCLCAIADSWRSMGEWEQAELTLIGADHVAQASLPTQHPMRAHVCERLGWLYMDIWRVEQARTMFSRALATRQTILSGGDLKARPYIFQNQHGKLAAERFLGQRPADDLKKEYDDLLRSIAKAYNDTTTKNSTDAARQELLVRLVNSYERAADVHLFSRNSAELIGDLAGNPSESPRSENALRFAENYLNAATGFCKKLPEVEQWDLLPRLCDKRAIVQSLRRRNAVSDDYLRDAATSFAKLCEAKYGSTRDASLKGERPLHRELSPAIVALTRSIPSSGAEGDVEKLKACQADLRALLATHCQPAAAAKKKRDEVELALFAAGLLMSSHGVAGGSDEARRGDIEQFESLAAILNASPPQLRRYLRPYYGVAIQTALAVMDVDPLLAAKLICECKYGRDLLIDPLQPTILFYVDKTSILAFANGDEKWSIYRDCLSLTPVDARMEASGARVIMQPEFNKLIEDVKKADNVIQLYWSDPDLDIQSSHFPDTMGLKVVFLPEN